MESGGASKWSMANLRSANEELRQHVIQLKAELEQERKQSRQAHREKVAGIRTARDEEQAKGMAAREDLKNKMTQERATEIQGLKEDTERQRELEFQLLARQHEENMKNEAAKHKQEKSNLEKHMKTQVYQQARHEIQEQCDADKKKLMHEMFEMQTVKQEAERRMQIAVDSDRKKAEKIRQLMHEHQEEIQRLRRESRRSSRQQTEELKSKERELHQKEQELAAVARKAAVVRAEKEQVEEKLKRMQEAESWQKMSPRASTPGLGDMSFEAVTSPAHMRRFTDEEKRRIAHSAELSQLNRRLEEKNNSLIQEKEELQHELDEARQVSQPLEAKCEKLMKRNNQLVTTMRESDRKTKKMKEETESMKEERDMLMQKVEQLEKMARRQPVRVGDKQVAGYKSEIEMQSRKIEEQKKTITILKEKNVRLKQRLEVVKTSRQSLMLERDQFRSPGLSKSWDEESVGSTLQEDLDQAVFEKDEMDEKYKEMMKERLKLERSYAQMQVWLGMTVDIERDKLMREQMAMDLSESQNKVFVLETKLEDERHNVEEMIQEEKRGLEEKVREQEEQLTQTRLELEKALEDNETQVKNVEKELKESAEEMIREEKQELEEKLREQKEQLAQTRLELEKDLEENKTQVTTLKKELEEALKACSEKEQELLGIQEQLAGSVSEVAEHETARKDTEQSLLKMRQEMDDLKTALLESQSQLADQQKRNEELMEKETEIEHMRNQIDELESLQTASAAVIEEMQEKLDSLTTKLASAETQTYELKETHSAEVKRLEEELDRAERRKSDDVNLAVEELETQLKMTMSELDGHKEAAEQSRERVEELENSLIELREKLVEKEDTAAMLLTVQERNRQLDEKVNGLEKQLAEGQQLLEESRQLVEKLRENEDTLKQEITSLQENEHRLKENVGRLEDSENGLKECVEKLQDSERRLKELVEELKENENRLKQEVDDLQNELSAREKVAVDELVSLDTSNITFVSVHEQNGEVDEFTQILRNRIRELESLVQGTQQQQIEEEAKRILSLRNLDALHGDEVRPGHLLTDENDEDESPPPLPASAPPPLDSLAMDSTGTPVAATDDDAMNSGYRGVIDQLEAELTALGEKCQMEERKRKSVEERSMLLEKSHEMLEERVAHLTELQISNDSLEAGNEQLSAEVARLQVVEKECGKLQSQIQENDDKMKAWQSELSKLQRERDEMNALLTEQLQDLDVATDERRKLKEKIRDVEERQASDYEKYVQDMERQSQVLDEEKGRRIGAEKKLAPLEAGYKFLERKCTAKDDLISDLNTQLAKLKKALTGSLLEDLSVLDEESKLERQSYEQQMKNHTMNSMDLSEALRTIDEAHLANSTLPPSGADGLQSPEIRLANERPSLSPTQPSLSHSSRLSHRSGSPFMENTRMFVTLFDYDPEVLCTTQHPELELKLTQGDVLAISNDMNESGMYLAEFDGRQGLVPANFVEELHINDPLCKSRLISKASTPDVAATSRTSRTPSIERPFSPEYRSVDSVHQPGIPSVHSEGPDLTKWNDRLESDLYEDNPDPPEQLCVERQLDNRLLVAWKPPELSPLGKSNGTIVAGYKVYIDEEEHSLQLGAEKTKALLENINLTSPREIGLQTVGRNGRVSQTVAMTFCGRWQSSLTSSQRELFRGATPLHVEDEDSVGGDSVGALEDAVEPFNMFIALYDYHPSTMSPNPDPEAELEFKEGDLIKVFGEENADGFFSAKLNGQEGLVPSNFIERVSSSWSQQRSMIVRQVHEQRLRLGNLVSPRGAHLSDSEELQSQTDSTSDISSDAVTDTKRLFVGTYPGMPHITSGLSVTASNGRQSPRRVSFVTDSDDSDTAEDEQLPTKKPSVLMKGKQLIKRISGIRNSSSKSNSTAS